jgi:hypothetical protein
MKNTLILIVLSVIIFGCGNPSNENVLNVVNKDVPFFKQVFLINPLIDTVLKCKLGTEIHIKANSFCYEDLSSVKSTIELEISEYIHLTDMILNNLSTLSDNKIIETGGMLNITGKANNKKISLKENNNIKVQFNSNPKDFSPFYSNSKLNNQSLNWEIDRSQGHPTITSEQDTSLFIGDTLNWDKHSKNLNILSFNKLGWINCDRFLNFDNITEVYVKVEGRNMDSSTFCSVILKNYNSIIPGKIVSDNSMRFSPLPVNEEVTLFLVSYKDGNYYMGIRDVFVKEKETYSVALELVSKEQLKLKIEEFDKGRPL